VASTAVDLRSGSAPRDSRWIVPAAAFVAAQYIAALIISAVIRPPESPPTASYMLVAAVISCGCGLFFFLKRLRELWLEDEDRPIHRLLVETDLSAVLTYLMGFQLIALQIGALTWLKQMLPYIVPFWADPALARIDRAIVRTDAWRLIPTTLVHPLDLLYPFWAPVKFSVLIFILALPASSRKSQALLSYFLTVGLLGVIGQYLLSSAGPVFYFQVVGKPDFMELLQRNAVHAPFVGVTAGYLWHDYIDHSSVIGSGISAMPSMHVATTTWTALAIRALWPRIRLLGLIWWTIIFLGSIALGWHYFVDSVCATLGALACWKLSSRFFWTDRTARTGVRG
jgi:hypothetical protein